MDAFASDLNALQHRLRQTVGPQDLKYFRNCEIAGRICTVVGFATAWLIVNPISILLIAIVQKNKARTVHRTDPTFHSVAST